MCSIGSEVIQSFQVSTDVIHNLNHHGDISVSRLHVLNVCAPHLFTRFFPNIPYGTFDIEIIHFQKLSYTVMATDLYAVG
jgi:hypothetical protein